MIMGLRHFKESVDWRPLPLVHFALRHVAIASVALLSMVGTCFSLSSACEDFDVSCQPLLLLLFNDYGPKHMVIHDGGTSPRNMYSYAIDPYSGSLSYVSGPFSATNEAEEVLIHNGSTAYNLGSVSGDQVKVFSISGSGELANTQTIADSRALSHAIHSSGNLYFYQGGSPLLNSFFIGADGTLTSTGQAPFGYGCGHPALQSHPSGSLVGLSTVGANAYVLSVDSGSGAVAQLQSYTSTTTGQTSLAMDPLGRFAYAYFNTGVGGTFEILQLDSGSGLIQSSQTYTFTTSNTTIRDMHINGDTLYASTGISQLLAWKIGADGVPTSQLQAIDYSTTGLFGIDVDGTGRYLYAAEGITGNSALYTYQINSDGSLTQVAATDVGFVPRYIATTSGTYDRF